MYLQPKTYNVDLYFEFVYLVCIVIALKNKAEGDAQLFYCGSIVFYLLCVNMTQ